MSEPKCAECWVQDDPPKYPELWHTPEDHDKENSVSETAVTPEEVAATAPDEADDIGPLDDQEAMYQINPAEDPDEAAPEEDVAPNALTAFLVVVKGDGSAFATADITKIGEILPAREATIVDMRRACQEVVHDVNAMQVSQQTVALMQQSAQEMAEQARSEAIARKLREKGIQVQRR